MNTHTTKTITRVGYALALIGFFQVGAVIAPRVADTLPFSGWSAYALGWGIAAVFDLTWATIGYSAIRTHTQGNHRATITLTVITLAVIGASTALLASVGHQGFWSLVPAVAALLIGISAVLDGVLIDAETTEKIRVMRAESRAALALARAESDRDTVASQAEVVRQMSAGRATIARKTTEARLITDMKNATVVAQSKAVAEIDATLKKHGEMADRYDETFATNTHATDATDSRTESKIPTGDLRERIIWAVLNAGATSDQAIADAIGETVLAVQAYFSPSRGASKIYGNAARAREYGVETGDHAWPDLVAASNGICDICDNPLNVHKHGRDEDSVSIDHVIPMSQGGPNTIENIHLVHYLCNSRKGTLTIEETKIPPTQRKRPAAQLELIKVEQVTEVDEYDEIDVKILDHLNNDDMKPAEIADKIGISRATVYRRISRLRSA